MTDRGELNDYLFGDIDPERRALIEARIARDPDLRERARQLRAMTDRLEEVPQAGWEYVDARTQEPAPPTSVRRAPFRRRIALGGLAAVAAAAAVLALVLAGSGSPHRQTVRLSALAGAPADSWASATITASGRISVSVMHLPPTDRDHHYELWLMTSTTDLVPVGSFRVGGDGSAKLSMSLPTAPQRYRYLDVSLQPDGSNTAISAESLLRGPTSPS
jgi:anti-sigma-K factor RskA